MSKPESHRRNWALGLSITLSVFIFIGFGFYRGFLSFGERGTVVEKRQELNVASVAASKDAPSPIIGTKEAFKAGWGEVKEEYNKAKESIYNVFVPFVTGIEIYEKK